MSARFRFVGRACAVDNTGYYHPHWDLAQPVSVIAKNRGEAMAKAEAMLGPCRSGRTWHYRWDSIDEVAEAVDHD